MASISEIQSLENISYKSKIKAYFFILLTVFLFALAFLNFFPVSDKLKGFMRSSLAGTGCSPDFDQIRMEWIMPKIVISDLELPASCLGRMGDPLKFRHVTLNYQLINFAPFGLPFRLDTELNGQPLTLYFVQGIGSQMIRLKDQKLSLTRLQPLLGDQFKLAGNVTVDMSLSVAGQELKHLSLIAESRDLSLPSQN